MTSCTFPGSTHAIKAIDPSSVHRICSGQVIIDLATAVKELIENSLDAGSTTIDIRLKEYGSELIEVSDDGTGVAKEDRKVLMKKYYTSKLSSFDDLERISTFGFRGEALSSLCAVGHVVAVTKVAGEECGVKLEYDAQGDLIRETLTARAVGTTISVRHLFHSLPVRHKEFTKNIKRDYSKLVSLLHAYSLVHTNVRFLCTNQVGNGTARSIVLSSQHRNRDSDGNSLDIESVRASAQVLFGKRAASSLLPVTSSNDTLGVKVEGLVSGTGSGSGSSKGNSNFFYVNKRPIQFPKAASLLSETYKAFVSPAQTQKPICILNFQIDTDKYDVNVTPDKRKVFFHHEVDICRFMQECVAHVWDAQRSTFTVEKVINTGESSKYVDRKIDTMLTPQNRHDDGSEIDLADEAGNLKNNKTIIEQEPAADIFDPNTSKNRKKRKISDSFLGFAIDSPRHHAAKSMNGIPVVEEREAWPSSGGDNVAGGNVETLQDEISQFDTIETQKTHTDQSLDAPEKIGMPHNTLGDFDEQDDMSAHCKDIKVPGEVSSPKRSDIVHNFVETYVDTFEETHVPTIQEYDEVLEEGEEDEQEHTMSIGTNANEQANEKKDIQNDRMQYNESKECDIHEIRRIVLEQARKSLADHFETNIDKRELPFEMASMSKCANVFQEKESFEEESKATNELKKVFRKENFRKMQIIGQFNMGFIIARLGNDLFIIDQHASDEKFTFENLQRNTKFKMQRLIKPIELHLSPREEDVVKQNMKTFSNSGFQFEESDDGVLKVTSVPHCKGITFGASDVLEMIDMIERGERSLWHLEASSAGNDNQEGVHAVYPSRFKALLASKACRTSIMIGKTLTHTKMKEIVSNLSTLVSPWNCPHGRPTMRHLVSLPDHIARKKST